MDSTKSSPSQATATLYVADSKSEVAPILHERIITSFKERKSSNKFIVAISGGSLPSFLAADALIQSFKSANVDPEWEKWFVMLADERCVPNSHSDSNYRSIHEHFLRHVPIPDDQIFPISDELLKEGTSPSLQEVNDIAKVYEENVKTVLTDEGVFDCILLGFGPDGHTCSLFPEHNLLNERIKIVASIMDSPKPPPERITLTFPVLDQASHTIFCGCGASKAPILDAIFSSASQINKGKKFFVTMANPSPYPCGMVKSKEVSWVVDSDALSNVSFNASESSSKM